MDLHLIKDRGGIKEWAYTVDCTQSCDGGSEYGVTLKGLLRL